MKSPVRNHLWSNEEELSLRKQHYTRDPGATMFAVSEPTATDSQEMKHCSDTVRHALKGAIQISTDGCLPYST